MMDPNKEFKKNKSNNFIYLFIKLILNNKIGKNKFQREKLIQMFTRKKISKNFPKFCLQKATFFCWKKSLLFPITPDL